ncbi:MAG: tetratricopeptide repeat protein [Elusimicrobia bacterium]|nr:tetratricopeptide repeat protein [Elusimicrobiota bacterium]MBD3411742.1 tetratricopeptide repeat protein [Elusimicrobiota bacterium]
MKKLFIILCLFGLPALLFGSHAYPVTIFVDEEFRSDPQWFYELKLLLDEVNRRYKATFDIEFVWSEPQPWGSDNSLTTIYDLLTQLSEQTEEREPGIILGFTDQKPLSGNELGVARYYTGQVMIRKTPYMTETVMHEFGHVFGAVHINEPVHLMNAVYSGQQNLPFDLWNTKIINLHVNRSFNPTSFPLPETQAQELTPIYEDMLVFQRSDTSLLINLAAMLIRINRIDDAIRKLREAESYYNLELLDASKDQAKNQYYLNRIKETLGMALIKKGEYRDAVYVLDDVAREEPNNTNILWNKAVAYVGMQDYMSAQRIFEAFLETMPDDLYVHLYLGQLYAGMNIPAKAREEYRWVQRYFPDRFEGYYYQARFEADQGNLDTALGLYSEALKRKTDAPELYVSRALIYHQENMIDKAREDYVKAITLNPSQQTARFNLGIIYLNNNAYKDAKEQFSFLVEQFPDYAHGYLGLGIINAQENNLKTARKLLEKAIKLDRDLADAYSNLYHVYQKIGEEKKAKKIAKKYRKHFDRPLPEE